MPTIKGKIDSVNFLKSGTGTKGPWTMFEVNISGQKFTAFGDSWQKMIGQEGDYEYKSEMRPKRDGTQYESRTLQSPRKAGGVNPQQLQNIENKLDEVIRMLKALNQPVQATVNQEMYPDPTPDQEINVDDIPF